MFIFKSFKSDPQVGIYFSKIGRKEENIKLNILFENKQVELKKDQEFPFSPDYDLIGNERIVGLTYPDLAVYVNKPGIIILADDGKVSFEVIRIDGKMLYVKF